MAEDLNSEMYRLCQKKKGHLEDGNLLVDLNLEELAEIQVYFEEDDAYNVYEKLEIALKTGQYVYYWSSW